jgi:hypothetical protein
MPISLFDKIGRLIGLVPHFQYRTSYETPTINVYESLNTEQAAAIALEQKELVIERYHEFSIGHIEFDDQGQAWDLGQLEAIVADLTSQREDTSENGVMMVCFMHGWKNNAAHNNENLKSFREMLSSLAKTETTLASRMGLQPRRIFGVFLSWRGESNSIPFAKELTFWNRKKTAHKIGRGDLGAILSRLEQVRFSALLERYQSRMIIIGHSFGGAAVFSAVGPSIRTVTEGEYQSAKLNQKNAISRVQGFGDLIILVNPAFEAQLYHGFNELTRSIRAYSKQQHVVMMTVGAENDSATGLYFPFGQFLARWLEKRRDLVQFQRITTSVANLDYFITHRLEMRIKNSKVAKPISKANSVEPFQYEEKLKGSGEGWEDFMPSDSDWTIVENPERRRMPDNFAFMTVNAEKEIVDGHSGIFLPNFIEFIRDFVVAQDIYSFSVQSRPSTLDAHTTEISEAAVPAPKSRSGLQNKNSAGLTNRLN